MLVPENGIRKYLVFVVNQNPVIEIEFILMDADYSISNNQRESNIHLWGKSGHKRVEVVVKGFFPYFYIYIISYL